MQELGWLTGAINAQQGHARPSFQEDFRRGARGETPITEVLLTLAHHQEEQERTAAELLERETWALTALLERSAPIWRYLPDTTLRFVLDQRDGHWLEVGYFSHLSVLVEPSADEEALVAATAPCWAHVSLDRRRQLAGQTGAFARSYEQISAAEAVATLGFSRILTQIELSARTAAQNLVVRAEVQRGRQVQLSGVERMLGVEPDPPIALLRHSKAIHACLALFLLGSVGIGRLALGGALWVIVVLLAGFLVSIPQPMLVLLLGIGLAPLSLYLGARPISRGGRNTW